MRWRNEQYLAWVRRQPCVRCKAPDPTDPHHVIGLGSTCMMQHVVGGAMGSKAPDWAVMSLCRPCHDLLHRNPTLFPHQWEWALMTLGRYVEEVLVSDGK